MTDPAQPPRKPKTSLNKNDADQVMSDLSSQSNEQIRARIQPSRMRGDHSIHPADFDRNTEKTREFAHNLTDAVSFPKVDAASRDKVSLDISHAPKHIPFAGILLAAAVGLGILAIVFFVLPGMRKPSVIITPSPMISVSISGPKEGSLMAMGDGSVLAFISSPDGVDSNGQKGFWITLNAITNYQFSLCVQAGNCKAPTDSNALIDFGDLTKVDLPVSIVEPDIIGPDRSAGYCSWIGGRMPTDEEMKAFGDGSVRGFADGSVRGFADGSVRTFGAGAAGIQDDTVRGVHCVFDQPLPSPQFFGMSPYYDPALPMESMVPQVLKSVQFCQDKQGYQTLDFQLDDDEKLVSVNGDGRTNCQLVNANRIVCYGEANPNFQAEVGFQCDGARNLSCPTGSEFNGGGCSASGNFGMDDWELNANGVLMPSHGSQLPTGGVLGAKIPNLVTIHGVMVAEMFFYQTTSVDSPNTKSSDDNGCPVGTVKDQQCVDAAGGDASQLAQCPCVNDGAQIDSVGSDSSPVSFAALVYDCPVGFYFDGGAQACASLGAPQTECLSGFHFNGDGLACESDLENGNYPGCPKGELLNPLTGQCDAGSKLVSPTSFIMTINLPVTLPVCSGKDKIGNTGSGDEGSSDGGTTGCPAGYTYTCDPVCGCAPP